jgi:hypothetical protein
MIQGFIHRRSKRSCSSPKCPDQLWGPQSLFHMYQEFFLWGLYGQGIRFTTQLHLVLRLRISPIILKLTPTSLQCMNTGEFTATLISGDDSFCPPSPPKIDKRYNILHQLNFIIDASIQLSTNFLSWIP